MPADFQTTKITKPNPNGPYSETLVDAVHTATGPADAGKVVVLNTAGQIDISMLPFTTGGSFDLDDGTFLVPDTDFDFDDGGFV